MKTQKILALGLMGLSCFFGKAQNNFSTSSLTSGGLEAGGSSSGTGNTFYGYRAGKITNSTGTNNTMIGHGSGSLNTSGRENVFIGNLTGDNLTSGIGNVFSGYLSGHSNNGSYNVFVGGISGSNGYDGSYNVMLGYGAGADNDGNNNIFIGYYAGESENGNNKLYIENSSSDTPLIWGDFSTDQLKFNATKVGIGSITTFPTASAGVSLTNYKLFVKGGILADEVRVSTTWADYVFEENYKLPTLEEVEKHIKEKGHLINVPSGKQVETDGIEVGQMAKIQQEKIEELTLYIIEQNKINERQRQQLEKQGREIQEMKAMLLTLAKK